MDPFSITTASIGSIAAIAQLSAQVNAFASQFKDARNDMQELLQELKALSTSLESMRDDDNMAKYPASLRQNLLDTLGNCDGVTKEMGDLLRKLSSAGLFGRLKWSLSKREKLMGLKSKLEGHKSAIAIALLIASITHWGQKHTEPKNAADLVSFLTLETKDNTNKILSDTAAIRLETAQIPAQVTTLYQCMGSLQLYIRDLKGRGDIAEGDMFQRVVDNTTTYTASFIDHDYSDRTIQTRTSDEFFDAPEYPEAGLSTKARWKRPLRAQPQLVIAIDFGMTCTGVGWWNTRSSAPGNGTLHILQRWPGIGFAAQNKVPTVPAYRHGELLSWGFLARRDAEDKETLLFNGFKEFLDPVVLQTAKQSRKESRHLPETSDHVQSLCLDFLRMLYRHIEEGFQGIVHSWHNAEIEFDFPIPSSWSVGVRQRFENLVIQAGFGSAGQGHSCSFDMTEAEAAAVSAVTDAGVRYSYGSVILVADLGGMTTKLSLLKVTNQPNPSLEFEQLDAVEDNGVGSAMIDIGFQQLATHRLARVEAELGRYQLSVEGVVREMTAGQFQTRKAVFGPDEMVIAGRLRVPGLPSDFNSEEAKVERGFLLLTTHELQQLFDEQLRQIFQLVDHQMDKALSATPDLQASHIVLSGGLASSPYVLDQFRHRYLRLRSHRFITPATKFAHAPDPQLAVIRGLIMSRARLFASQSGDLVSNLVYRRVARISYGIVCNRLYNPNLHRDQALFRDETDGRVYARDQIKWIVLAGKQPNDTNEFKISMAHPVRLGKSVQRWSHAIVTSRVETDLPTDLHHPGVTTVSELTCDFSEAPKVLHAPSGAKHMDLHYSIAATVGRDGIAFEARLGGAAYGSASIRE
ncbi:uncharacterized protein A1O5_08264 [Cladophialophora psammophila CBS 110553]|uniref:Azaphilone pigments biosynthesis cluster protein L N-terminal domain-containing protein n=1 Tax=Cladophialophora psammophila CBS 110553 TaxID=1182543 RepID=W9WV05_9EURO|nr:uncharacterized protein A1O5_08264 [Cladophialophora psammophila CBS 110553]EXJ68471.1 hypothetical protein A1O5_08264 [Cladophialophora psammophila CBS 110553]